MLQNILSCRHTHRLKSDGHHEHLHQGPEADGLHGQLHQGDVAGHYRHYLCLTNTNVAEYLVMQAHPPVSLKADGHHEHLHQGPEADGVKIPDDTV